MRVPKLPPVWLMGLAGTSFGLVGGYVAFALPQALAARHVPEPTIATISAIAISPGFFSFLFSPLLDVWHSRRFYALLLWVMAALCTALSTLLLANIVALTVVATLGYFANQLASSALGGWLSTVCGADHENELAAWLTVSNIAGFGVFALLGGEMLRGLNPAVAAALIGCMILLPLVLFPLIPVTPPDPGLARENVRQFALDVIALLRRREVLLALAMFVLPCGTFSLTNMVAGLGGDYGASPRVVSLLGGAGVVVAGVVGSLVMPKLARHLPLRRLYLLIGAAGAVFTMLTLPLPRHVGSFTLLVVGENMFQSCAIACSLALIFEVIGAGNPLAATNYALLNSAYNVPIAYMLLVDGWGYGQWGLTGALTVDAVAALGAVAVLAIAFAGLSPGSATPARD